MKNCVLKNLGAPFNTSTSNAVINIVSGTAKNINFEDVTIQDCYEGSASYRLLCISPSNTNFRNLTIKTSTPSMREPTWFEYPSGTSSSTSSSGQSGHIYVYKSLADFTQL